MKKCDFIYCKATPLFQYISFLSAKPTVSNLVLILNPYLHHALRDNPEITLMIQIFTNL